MCSQLYYHLKRQHGINQPDQSKIALYNSGPEEQEFIGCNQPLRKRAIDGTVDNSSPIIGYLDGRLILPQCPDMFLADLIKRFPHIIVPSMSLTNNFIHQIYLSDLRILFMVRKISTTKKIVSMYLQLENLPMKGTSKFDWIFLKFLIIKSTGR